MMQRLTLISIISFGHPIIADVNHDSRLFAKFLIDCVKEPKEEIYNLINIHDKCIIIKVYI